MEAVEREVAGLRCGEVLAHLSALVDGELDGELAARIALHVRNCDVCARFGGAFAAVVARIREGLPERDPMPVTDAHLSRIMAGLDARPSRS
jgi:anti-sigma factor RsiW